MGLSTRRGDESHGLDGITLSESTAEKMSGPAVGYSTESSFFVFVFFRAFCSWRRSNYGWSDLIRGDTKVVSVSTRYYISRPSPSLVIAHGALAPPRVAETFEVCHPRALARCHRIQKPAVDLGDPTPNNPLNPKQGGILVSFFCLLGASKVRLHAQSAVLVLGKRLPGTKKIC